MMVKFKVGDRIKVVKRFVMDSCEFLPGVLGTIREDRTINNYVLVEFDNYISQYLHNGYGVLLKDTGYNIFKKHFGEEIILSVPNWKARLTPVGGKND